MQHERFEKGNEMTQGVGWMQAIFKAGSAGRVRGLRAFAVAAGLCAGSALALAAGIARGDKPAATGLNAAAERIKNDVYFLAADAQEGRAPGTEGIERAADHIAGVFKKLGLKTAPGADDYFQHFKIAGTPRLTGSQALAFTGPDGKRIAGELDRDFRPLSLGVTGSVKGVEIAFVGYGITARDAGRKLDYDDYAGIDVKGKAVLLLRHEPQHEDEKSPFDGKRSSTYATFRHKATNAFQHGAVAVLFANDQASLGQSDDSLMRFLSGGSEPNSNLPFVMVKRALADQMLKAAGGPVLADVEKAIDKDLKPQSRVLKGLKVDVKVDIDRPAIDTKNVVGVLEGTGPQADETVVIGGHYDHVGRGGLLSGSLAPFSHDIHNGADDNASGTSMVLELARRIASRQDAPPRRVVFMAFSGEERGLLGSQYYVEHPLYPLESTVLMINCDMVGRLNDKNELSMIGTGTGAGLKEHVDVLGKSAGLSIKQVTGMTDGFGGSDHQSFYPHKIPVLFAFTGLHKDYHRPSDDSDLINYAGMSRIADYLELIALDVIRRPERPTYLALTRPAQPPRNGGGDPARSGTGVYLGTMPDYADEGKSGLKLSGVSPGGPAEKAGIKGGDVIIKLGGKPVGTIYDFMESLGQYKPGDKVDVVVKRDGKDMTLPVTLGRRPNQ